MTEKDKTEGDAASSQQTEDKVTEKAKTEGDEKTKEDEDKGAKEAEKLKKKRAKHAEYMRFYRSVFECHLPCLFRFRVHVTWVCSNATCPDY